MENPQHFSYVFARVEHHKEKASRQSNVQARIWKWWQQQGIRGWSNLWQRSLCQKVRKKTPTRLVLSDFVERVSKRRKHLEAYFGNATPL